MDRKNTNSSFGFDIIDIWIQVEIKDNQNQWLYSVQKSMKIINWTIIFHVSIYPSFLPPGLIPTLITLFFSRRMIYGYLSSMLKAALICSELLKTCIIRWKKKTERLELRACSLCNAFVCVQVCHRRRKRAMESRDERQREAETVSAVTWFNQSHPSHQDN